MVCLASRPHCVFFSSGRSAVTTYDFVILQKDELRDFNFQRVFLGPFATIIRNSSEVQIRELVVR